MTNKYDLVVQQAGLAPVKEAISPHPDEDVIATSWQRVRLNDICSLHDGIVNPEENLNCKYVGLEHIDSGDPYLSRWGRASEVRSSKIYFYSGDVLYGKLRPYLDKAVEAHFDGI